MVLNGYLGRNHKIASDAVQSEDLRLTNRQREIVQLISEGNSSKEVAVILGISVKTAETHRGNIMQKIDCHSVAGLVRYAIRNHIIEA
jgi:DNA-binding CsgD family transcriptional regulator